MFSPRLISIYRLVTVIVSHKPPTIYQWNQTSPLPNSLHVRTDTDSVLYVYVNCVDLLFPDWTENWASHKLQEWKQRGSNSVL